nr:MAG TPA: hypothetical protein [Crassvirales sp.]
MRPRRNYTLHQSVVWFLLIRIALKLSIMVCEDSYG